MKPHFKLSKSTVLSQYECIKSHSDIVSYSSKTNQDVTRVLEEGTDSMFSVHFENELKHISDCSRVVFLAQAWDSKQISRLVELGIKWFVVDNESDLDVLVDFLKGFDGMLNVMLRMNVKENSIRTEKYYVFGMGCEVIRSRALQLHENTKVGQLGIHFHRKTQNMSEWNVEYELSQLFEDDFWKNIGVVNIGGGFPSEYANTNMNVLQGIFSKVDALRKWLNAKNVQLVTEPGRFIAAPAVKLVTHIVAIHESTIIVDASVYNSDMDAILVPVKLLVEGEMKKGDDEFDSCQAYVIKGITPCSMDLFRYRVYLKDVNVGDELVFLNAGAYNFTTDFCDLEKIETQVVE